jgi:hypothetical protein
VKKILFAVLVLASACTPSDVGNATDTQPPADRAARDSARERIETIAAGSQCRAAIDRPPRAYMRGMALVFARSVCERTRDDVKIVSAARGDPDSTSFKRKDGLAWYDPEFRALGMPNDSAGVDTLRHTYALLLDLGVRESSGRYCLGRFLSDPFNTADSAEAGPFQTSFGASTHNAVLPAMFARYQGDQGGCLLDVFSESVSCGPAEAKNWGEGLGAEWQKLTKSCPAFATEYAAVVLRVHGGSRGEYGPIQRKEAKIAPACDDMLLAVQQLVQSDPGICPAL